MKQTGLYEIAALLIGSAVGVWSVWQYWATVGHSSNCLTIGGLCVPFFLLFLTCIEVVGVFATLVFSTMRQSYVGAMILPHGAIAVAVTVTLSAVLRISVG